MPSNHSQLNAAQVMDGQFLEASRNSARLLEPTDATLDDVAAPVLLRVKSRRSPPAVRDVVQPLGNDRTYPVTTQPLADAAMAVGSIPGPLLRAPPAVRPMDADGIEHRFGVQGLARLTGTELDRQRQSGAIGDQVQLRAPASAATPERVVGGFVVRQFFFPRQRRPCGHARWSHRYTTTTTLCGFWHRARAARPLKSDPTARCATNGDSANTRSATNHNARASHAKGCPYWFETATVLFCDNIQEKLASVSDIVPSLK